MRRTLLVLGIVLIFPMIAFATPLADITYDYTSPVAGTYVFDFTVHNLLGPAPLDFFMITFDADADWSLYGNVAWVDDKGWFAMTDPYDPSFGGLPADAWADSSIFGSGTPIAIGGHLGGYKVSFSYTGSLAPADQLFSYYATFGTNQQGTGIPIGDPQDPDYWIEGEDFGTVRYVPGTPPGPGSDIPEPATGLLVGLGLCGGLIAVRRRAKSRRD